MNASVLLHHNLNVAGVYNIQSYREILNHTVEILDRLYFLFFSEATCFPHPGTPELSGGLWRCDPAYWSFFVVEIQAMSPIWVQLFEGLQTRPI